MKSIILASAIALASSTAFAADMKAQFDQVCQSPAIKSEKLTTACAGHEMPDVIKKGDRFKNVGIGAEVNTLAANLKFFTVGSN